MDNEIIPLQPSSNDSIQYFIYPIHNMNSIAFCLSPPLQILNQSWLNWYATKQQNEQPLWYTYQHFLQTAPIGDLGQRTSHLQQQQVVFGNSLKPKAWDTEGRAASKWHQPGQPQPCALCQAPLGIWDKAACISYGFMPLQEISSIFSWFTDTSSAIIYLEGSSESLIFNRL